MLPFSFKRAPMISLKNLPSISTCSFQEADAMHTSSKYTCNSVALLSSSLYLTRPCILFRRPRLHPKRRTVTLWRPQTIRLAIFILVGVRISWVKLEQQLETQPLSVSDTELSLCIHYVHWRKAKERVLLSFCHSQSPPPPPATKPAAVPATPKAAKNLVMFVQNFLYISIVLICHQELAVWIVGGEMANEWEYLLMIAMSETNDIV